MDVVAANARPPQPPEIAGLLYPGYFHLLSGESESLKTWLALAAAAKEMREGRSVLWVDGDDVRPGALLERLRFFGLDDDLIARLFVYVLPDSPLTEVSQSRLLEALQRRGCKLAVFDGFNPLLTLHGLSPDNGSEVERFYRMLDPIRKLPTAAVVTDNVVKSKEARGAWSIGSERKKSKADVHLGMRTLVPPVRGGVGRALIDVHKDRPGFLKRPSPGTFVLSGDTTPGGWEIVASAETRDAAGGFRPTGLMERVSRALELRPEHTMSRNQIEEMVSGKADYVRKAIDRLVLEGYATEFDGPRGARLVRLERMYREAEDEGGE